MYLQELIKKRIKVFSQRDYDRQANFISHLFYINLIVALAVVWVLFNVEFDISEPIMVTIQEANSSRLLVSCDKPSDFSLKKKITLSTTLNTTIKGIIESMYMHNGLAVYAIMLTEAWEGNIDTIQGRTLKARVSSGKETINSMFFSKGILRGTR